MARVLVVEDNATNLSLMVYLLKAFGHEPLSAIDVVTGIELARRERPDLALIDIHMPQVDGYEMVRRLRAEPLARTIPMVAVTALAMVGDREKVIAGGFDGYITKPIDPEAFMDQIHAYLDFASVAAAAIVRPEAVATAPAEPVDKPKPQATVLVVDNTPANVMLVRTILESAGYEVLTSSNAMEALAMARERRPALVLSDLHMPGHSGLDLLRMMKEDTALRPIPFLVSSASEAGGRWKIDCCRRGAQGFIGLPIEPEKLLREVDAVLETKGR